MRDYFEQKWIKQRFVLVMNIFAVEQYTVITISDFNLHNLATVRG